MAVAPPIRLLPRSRQPPPIPPALRPLLALIPIAVFLFVILARPSSRRVSFAAVHDRRLSDERLRHAIARVAVPVSHDHAPDGRRLVVMTAVNYAFRDYLLNLNCSIRRVYGASEFGKAGVRLLVVSLDQDMHHQARRWGFESLYLGGVTTGPDAHAGSEVTFGSKGFNLLSKEKLYAVYRVLKFHVDVLFTDADVVWCADVAAQLVGSMYSPWDDGVGDAPTLLMQTAWPRSMLNSGFYYARAGQKALDVFEAFLSFGGDAENDQVIVNRVMCRAHGGGAMVFGPVSKVHPAAPHRQMPALCRWRGGVDARILDGRSFPTGGELVDGEKLFHWGRTRIRRMCEAGDVVVLHNNCILSAKKKARFIVKGIWYVDDEDEGTCLQQPASATVQARRRCGGAKCGPEGDLHRFPDLEVR